MNTVWRKSWRADPVARGLADRHYNRQKPGSPQFVPPGSCLVFRTFSGDAVWTSSAPKAEYVMHAWAGAWVNTLFRNEGPVLSSELIRQAVALTLVHWPQPPEEGFVTMVDPAKVRSSNPGYCYLMAGWERWGTTKGGLYVFGIHPR